MRNINCLALSGSDNQTVTGSQIDANQLVSASFQAYFGDTQATGTFKLQASNDICNDRYQASNFVVTNWIDIPTQTASITSGGSALLTIGQMTYRWIRAVFTPTAAGVQTIQPVADTGAFEAITITCPATVDAAQGDYFVIYKPTGTYAAFWLDIDGAGTAPTGAIYLAATTKVKVSIITGGLNTDTAAAIIAAAATAQGYAGVDNMDGTVTYTQTALGACTAPSVHNHNDSGAGSFTTNVDTAGAASNLQSTYFLLQDEASVHQYYVWMNVSALGVDPAIAGRTGVPIAITAGDTAATIGSALATAIAALNSTNSFGTSGTTTVTVTNKVAGPFVPMTDGTPGTGFAFAVTAGGHTTVTVNLNALSL